MFIGLMAGGGVLADRYERGDSAGARYLRYWLYYWPVNALLPEPSLLAIYLWLVGRLFRVLLPRPRYWRRRQRWS